MTVLLALLGLWLLLHVPYLGSLVSHGIGHAFVHLLEHHEQGTMVTATAVLWLLLVLIPVAPLVGLWPVAADAALVLLIVLKVFAGGH